LKKNKVNIFKFPATYTALLALAAAIFMWVISKDSNLLKIAALLFLGSAIVRSIIVIKQYKDQK